MLSGHRILAGGVADSLSIIPWETADVVYTDPPWGPGNYKYWQAKAREANDGDGFVGNRDWNDFLSCLAGAVSLVSDGGPIFIEMGVQWVDGLVAAMWRYGLECSGKHTMFHGDPARPHVLCGFNDADVSDLPRECWAATREVVRRVAVPGGILFDPCLGVGKSAALFADAGMHVVGTEINRERLRRAAKRLGAALC